MKTKELVKKYIDSEDKDEFVKQMYLGIGLEVDALRKSRNIKFDRGLLSVFKDLDKKYQSVAMKVNVHYGQTELKPYIFRLWLRSVYPNAYKFYIESIT